MYMFVCVCVFLFVLCREQNTSLPAVCLLVGGPAVGGVRMRPRIVGGAISIDTNFAIMLRHIHALLPTHTYRASGSHVRTNPHRRMPL